MRSLPFRVATLHRLQPQPPALIFSALQADALTSFSHSSSGLLRRAYRHNRRHCLFLHAKGGSDRNAPPADAPPAEAPPADPAPALASSVEAAVEVFGLRPALMMLLGAAAFTVIALDVLLPGSLHVLAPVDTAVASWVQTNMPVTKDGRFVAKMLSNLPITLAMIGIGVTSLASGLQRPRATLQRLAAVTIVLTAPGAILLSIRRYCLAHSILCMLMAHGPCQVISGHCSDPAGIPMFWHSTCVSVARVDLHQQRLSSHRCAEKYIQKVSNVKGIASLSFI